MTNPQYKGVVIIIAGYTEDIDLMLEQNQGLARGRSCPG